MSQALSAQAQMLTVGWSCDAMDRLLTENNSRVHQCTYDAVGNRTSNTISGTAQSDRTVAVSNRLSQESAATTQRFGENGASNVTSTRDGTNIRVLG